MNRQAMTRMLWTAALAMMTLTGLTPASGQESPLAEERWRDQTYGISLRPPLDSKLHEMSADDALLRIVREGAYAIKLSVKKSTSELTLEEIKRSLLEQLAAALPPPIKLINDQAANYAGRPSALLYLGYQDKRGQQWVVGEALVQLDPQTVAVLQFDTSRATFENHRGTFEAVLASLNVQSAEELDMRNRLLIQAGQKWYQSVDRQRLLQSLTPEQWYRIVAPDGRDTGYMRMRQVRDTVMEKPGVRVELQAHVEVADHAIDSLSHFFVSDDNVDEVWSIKTTRRESASAASPASNLRAQPSMSWVVTGVRAREVITVTEQTPSARNQYKWHKPAEGYVSQAELFLLPAVMVSAPAGEMGFYAYSPAATRIALRIEKIEHPGDAALKLTSHPVPDQAPQVSFHDANGQLLKRVLPDGQQIVPATLQEIAARWKIK